MVRYACPRCKFPLDELTCPSCATTYTVVADGIPCLLAGTTDDTASRMRALYDGIYRHHLDVWEDQGRSTRFVRFLSDLAASYSTGTVLEIGCGEGAQLAALTARDRFGIDLSVHALVRARQRSDAACAVARAEELPFPAESIELVVAVGVMEHFEDSDAAVAEIRRVLSPSGHYIALIHTDMSLAERVMLKLRQFLLPPRPLALLRWVRKKMFHPIVQPLRKSYTIASARACLERNGLYVTRLITRNSHPTAPLAGRHVVILIAARSSTVRRELTA